MLRAANHGTIEADRCDTAAVLRAAAHLDRISGGIERDSISRDEKIVSDGQLRTCAVQAVHARMRQAGRQAGSREISGDTTRTVDRATAAG